MSLAPDDWVTVAAPDTDAPPPAARTSAATRVLTALRRPLAGVSSLVAAPFIRAATSASALLLQQRPPTTCPNANATCDTVQAQAQEQAPGASRSWTAKFARWRSPHARAASNERARLALRHQALCALYSKKNPSPLSTLTSWKALEQQAAPWVLTRADYCNVCNAALSAASVPLLLQRLGATSDHCRLCGRVACSACLTAVAVADFCPAGSATASSSVAPGKTGSVVVCTGRFCAETIAKCATSAGSDTDGGWRALLAAHAALDTAAARAAYLAPGLHHLLGDAATLASAHQPVDAVMLETIARMLAALDEALDAVLVQSRACAALPPSAAPSPTLVLLRQRIRQRGLLCYEQCRVTVPAVLRPLLPNTQGS